MHIMADTLERLSSAQRESSQSARSLSSLEQDEKWELLDFAIRAANHIYDLDRRLKRFETDLEAPEDNETATDSLHRISTLEAALAELDARIKIWEMDMDQHEADLKALYDAVEHAD